MRTSMVVVLEKIVGVEEGEGGGVGAEDEGGRWSHPRPCTPNPEPYTLNP